jgi:hypothetical protein
MHKKVYTVCSRLYVSYEACTIETGLMMLTGEGITTVTKHHHKYLHKSPTDAQVQVFHVQRIPWAAV